MRSSALKELTAEKRGIPIPSASDDPGKPMEDRILAAAERITSRQNIFQNGDTALRRHQKPACANFCEYFLDRATDPGISPLSSYCRIVLPPRTGKTVVAGQILCLAGLCATFVVPSKTLIKQTEAEFANLLQGMPIGIYYSEKKQPVANGINITTYATLQRHFTKGLLPQEIRQSAIVFFDEAHHAMTPLRLDTIAKAFAPQTIRVALTATPDYNKDRRLGRFFPELIHEIDLFDGFEKNLLAPARMWVVEVDVDASTIQLIAGDFEKESLGRFMSASPFFKAVEIFRYSEENRNTPAMIACASRQQANDLWTYLKHHRPAGRPLPGLVLGETPLRKRDRLLSAFKNGRIDTLIQVGVLIEGWNAPHCKLLLDMAPSVSRVRATQKYFRVMTRYKEQVARIVVILPKNLPRLPILPTDLMLKPGDTYECGDLLTPVREAGDKSIVPLFKMKKSPIQSIEIKTRILAGVGLRKPTLDPNDPDQIRAVLRASSQFQVRMRFGLTAFKRIFFNHPAFIGTGRSLLRYLGIADTKRTFDEFMMALFPNDIENHYVRYNQVKAVQLKNDAEDIAFLRDRLFHSHTNNGKPDTGIIESLGSLCGGAVMASPEDILLIREQISIALKAMEALDPRSQSVIAMRLGLFGNPPLTWLEIGDALNVSKNRALQIFWRSVMIMRRRWNFSYKKINPVRIAMHDYPDSAAIYDAIYERDRDLNR